MAATLVAGLIGIVAALALPFAPVIATGATVTWSGASGSSTAYFVPYRPAELTATVPCQALRTGGTVLATGTAGEGLVMRRGDVLVGGHEVALRAIDGDCRVEVTADGGGVTVTDGDGRATRFDGEPVPEVFAFRTDVSPELAQGITVTARTASVFATSPTALKLAVVMVQLLSVATVLGLLLRLHPVRRVRWRPVRWRVAAVDGAVIAVLLGWAVIGPLAVDDGWATMIARTFTESGQPGNYYRWWNASETPFALSQQVLSVFTNVGLAPLWLRVPSTLLGVATWFVLSRGVLGAALPALARTPRVRLLAALFFLAAWLPYNLGARPESYVAFGVTTLLAALWLARTPAGIGAAALVAAVTVAVSPSSVIVAAPLIVFAPRIVRIVRAAAASRREIVAYAVALSCVGALALTVVFADSTWDALVTATDWHQHFGPSLPWYEEGQRYRYLLGDDQQGSFAKRLPVVMAVALLPTVALLYAGPRRRLARAAARLGCVTVFALLALSLGPSKWSYHFGGLAGIFAAFCTVAVVFVLDRAQRTEVTSRQLVAGCAGGILAALAAALVFGGHNAWWLPALYTVPWADRPIPWLDSPLPWVLLVAGVWAVTRARRTAIAAPAVVTTAVAAVSVAILVGSFVVAPVRHSPASLAMANLRSLAGDSRCGLADDIEVLADGAALRAVTPPGPSVGFVAQAGYAPSSPPPDPVGTGMSEYIWGSYGFGAQAQLTTPWFELPQGRGLTLSVSGHTGDGNWLTFEFGRDEGAAVRSVGETTPDDPNPPGGSAGRMPWRAVAVAADQIPAEANRVRLRATDVLTGRSDFFAFTGPRWHSPSGLTSYLASRPPALVAWPMAFLFPCLDDRARVANGLAQAPGAVIVSPGSWFTEPMVASLGGNFAGLWSYGRLYEVPARVIGDSPLDWGALLLPADPSARDGYEVKLTETRRSGHVADRHGYQVSTR